MDNSSRIPTYTVELSATIQPDLSFHYLILQKRQTPSHPPLPSFVYEVLENLSLNFANSLDKWLESPVSAKISFSLGKGLYVENCSDERIRTFVQRTFDQLVIPIPANAIADLSFIKQVTVVDEEVKALARKQLQGEEVVFLNALAYQCVENDVVDPVEIDLVIDPRRMVLGAGGGLTTGILRYPHLLRALFEKMKNQPFEQICLLGPGLFEEAIVSCPQFVELFCLSPNSHFLILDHDKRAVELLKQQLHVKQVALYDPWMLKMRSSKKDNGFRGPEKYDPLFTAMKVGMSQQTAFPKKALSMLNGVKEIQPLELKVKANQIELREFDIYSTPFKKEEMGTFDVVIATMSLSFVIAQEMTKDPKANVFAILGKVLKLLKVNGSLYIDTVLFKDVLERHYGKQGMELGIRYLEHLIGNRFIIEEIPLSDFLPNIQGYKDFMPNVTIQQAQQSKQMIVSTSSITAITRSSEKVALSKEEGVQIIMALVTFLKNRSG